MRVPPKKVIVGERAGEVSHYIVKGQGQTYGIVQFSDGSIEEVFHKDIKYFKS